MRNLAVQYESDLTHTEHVARLALQMHESLVEAGLFEPRPGGASCCGRRRCCTTSA